jgi:hypothetical protein
MQLPWRELSPKNDCAISRLFMLLYDKAGLAFIHVPKNGGQSIRAALDVACPINLAPTAQDLGMTVDQLKAVAGCSIRCWGG